MTRKASTHERVYRAIGASGPLTRAEIAVGLGVPPQSISTAMRWLIRGDWIDSEGDRNPLRWSLSGKEGIPPFPDAWPQKDGARDEFGPIDRTGRRRAKRNLSFRASCVFDWASKVAAMRGKT